MKQFGPFCLDTANECLWRDGTAVSLPPKPFAVLRYLVENPGRLISHNELLDALWPETYVQPQVLRTYVLTLRKVLNDSGGESTFIQTLPKRGYSFVAPVLEESRHPPLSSVDASEPRTSLVGRELELSSLMAKFQLAAAGQRQLVFVTGEAGIGKSALVDAFCQSRHQAIAARGQCVEGLGTREEFYPVMEMVSHLCASSEGALARTVLSKLAPAWLEPPRLRMDGSEEPNLDRRRAGDLCAALEELASSRPLLLVFEDLQWADAATLNLISALARRRAAARLLVLATCGRQDLIADHPLRALKQDLRMRQLCTELAPGPLTKAAITQLVRNDLKQNDLPPEVASFIHHRSEGNPMFARNLLEHLIADRFLVPGESTADGAGWKLRGSMHELEPAVPRGLAEMIELELERLTPEEQAILEAGSLIGIAFPAWSIAAALEQDPAAAEEACDRLMRHVPYIRRAGQDELPDGARSDFYVFVHGIYREVLYQRQTTVRRAQRHLRIAERLRQMFAGREGNVAREIALHYEAAGQPNRNQAD